MSFDTNICDYNVQYSSFDTIPGNVNVNVNSLINTINSTYADKDIDEQSDHNLLNGVVISQSTCAMCYGKIKDCGLYSKDHKLIFCDMVCAKIYSDNISKIDIDFKEYRNNFILKKLSTSAEKIYQKYKYKFFQQLPILTINENDRNILNQYLTSNQLKEYRMKYSTIKAMF